jgi:hypothetical protein
VHIEQKLQLLFNMANATQTGVNREAGLYAFSPSYTNLYLNYTSVVATNGSGYDLTRQIQLEAGSTFPASLDL